MELDLRGKVKEKKLSYNNTLLPLFEAIVNSVQAIQEDSKIEDGKIEIEIIRSSQTQLDNNLYQKENKIIGFNILDNGVGFNSRNFESFNLGHSTYKENIGGKGIGRFIWLRAFKKVKIASRYKENDSFFLRKFEFLMTKNGIEKHDNIQSDVDKIETEVSLVDLKPDYQKWCNQNIDEIAEKIIEHCLIYFLFKNCPKINIIDGKDKIDLNEIFSRVTKNSIIHRKIKIKNDNFELNIVKQYSDKLNNKIHFCAHSRKVSDENLKNSIPELESFLVDIEGKKFSLAIYVTGKYLDSRVNEERTSILFDKQNDKGVRFPGEIYQNEIIDQIINNINVEFKEEINKLTEDRTKIIDTIIQDNPRYKQLKKYKKEELRKISLKGNSEAIEVELFKVYQNLELEIKTEANQAIKLIEENSDLSQYQDKFNDLYKKIVEVGNSKLSEYILHRRLIIELLEKNLKPQNGKFIKEDIIHSLIFPLKKLSDEIGYEDHNLWVIDERLSYHKYLASDKKFSKIEEIESDSDQRSDIIIFNKPFAFANDEKPYESIVIIEFKRPMRDDYDDDQNPILQINKYAREIIESEVKDKNEREFDLRKNTPIYSYIVCDLTKKLKQFASDAGYKLLPDSGGYFFFNDNYNMYVEIISFDKLIRDSKERNRVLFDKLNI